METKNQPDADKPLTEDPSPPRSVRLIDANELRWLGEEADGKRSDKDETYVIVWRKYKNKNQWRLGLVRKGQLKPGDEQVAELDVKTKFDGPGLRKDAKLRISYDKQPSVELRRRRADGEFEYP